MGPLFGKMLKVKRNPNGVQHRSNKCYKASTQGGINAKNFDLVLIVTMTDEPRAGFLAWASSCSKDPGSLRPNVGQINFNRAGLKTSKHQTKKDWAVVMEN